MDTQANLVSNLASEILLFIFLYLDSYQLVLCRRVSRQFREVIDNYQLLWRIFEWNQQVFESFKPALDMFDEHSHSSLEKVSIQDQRSNRGEDLLHLMQVLNRSKETLRELKLKVSDFRSWREEDALELVAAGSRLRRMVLWFWGSKWSQGTLPLSRLVFSSLKAQSSTVDQLQVLWAFRGIGGIDSKHLESLKSLKSLVSFAQHNRTGPLEFRELISNFSETIVHLNIRVEEGTSMSKPLLCPNLKVFEGWVMGGLSSFFEAPKLQTLFLDENGGPEIRGIPSSVEEIWLRFNSYHFLDRGYWEPLLLHSCPKLKILKVLEFSKAANCQSWSIEKLLKTLDSRNQRARHGIEINGIKIVSLQRLVLRTDLLSKEESDRVAKAANQVIDLKDYPKFIKIKC